MVGLEQVKGDGAGDGDGGWWVGGVTIGNRKTRCILMIAIMIIRIIIIIIITMTN